MDPNNAQTHYLLGSAYQALGRAEDASREFNLNRTLRIEQDSHTPTLSDPASRP
jgi:Flp pilus assembly protein TadD